MKKLIPIVFALVIIPQITMAAWWKPWSWNWGSFMRSDRASEVLKQNAEKKVEKTTTTKPQPKPSVVPVTTSTPESQISKVEIRANGTKGWIRQTDNVVISWTSNAKECTLSLEDMAYSVPGIGNKDFKLSFSGPYDTKHPTFWIGCYIDGKWVSDNVVVGGLLQ
ncbi:hypothetical protein KW796_01555 [Candidatus Parcubacteria bacterium]|nr:hypothetical protein [Candidatus Parcubacteria bacterium]